MDSYIQISAINDFLFCPKSLYLHSIYSSFSTDTYHDIPQVVGTIAHENIDTGKYTTSKHVLQGISISSAKLKVNGKIDLYDVEKRCLIERKYRVKQVYLGFKYQLYAQMYCLLEEGYLVNKLFIHSLSDNKRYEIPNPTEEEKFLFEQTVEKIRLYSPEDIQEHNCIHCKNHIYDLLHW